MIADLLAAWKLRAARRGAIGTALLFVGSLTPAFLPQNSPWWEPLRALGWDTWEARVVGTTLVVAGVGLLLHGWFSLRPSNTAGVRYWAVGTLWAIPLLLSPPIFSHDAYGYAAEGWLVHNDLNPYDYPVSTQPGPFADQVAWLWRYDTAMYPPLSLQIFHAAVIAGGLNPYYSTLMMRVPAVVGVCLISYYVPRIAKRMGADVPQTAWFALINPMLLVDLVGGAHNDALMLGLVVWALWLAFTRPRWLPKWLRERGNWTRLICFAIPPLVIGVAACIKQPAALAALAVPLIKSPWVSLRLGDSLRALGRMLASLALTTAAFIGVSLACGLGFGWMKAAAVPAKVVTLAPLSWIGHGLKALFAWVGQPDTGETALQVVQVSGLAIFAVFTVALGLKVGRTKPVTWLSWSYLAFAVSGLAMHPWYLTWGGLLVPLTKPSPRVESAAVILTGSLLAYSAGNLAWRNEALPLGFLALGLVALLLTRYLRQTRARQDSQ
jgi:alpha-1,6-mannosyltransferase